MAAPRLFIFSVLLFSVVCATGQTYWQQRVDYDIEARLDDSLHTIDGKLNLKYYNHSPDTLRFIWFHIWPNAYKNDQTDFSEQSLGNGSTEFYFSKQQDKGYLNRLNFEVDGTVAQTQDHSSYQDVIRLILPRPLPPGGSIDIYTPFHVQLPRIFSRSGHEGNYYQVTQWYPKPAVYDRKGWHPMPYLDQGEFYSEFGDFNVRILLPAEYTVAATGELKTALERTRLDSLSKAPTPAPPVKTGVKKAYAKKSSSARPEQSPSKLTGKNKRRLNNNNKNFSADSLKSVSAPAKRNLKTLHFQAQNVHDFAWFASKEFIIRSDTLALPSGKQIEAFVYFLPKEEKQWKRALEYVKDAIYKRSKWLADYPYSTVSVVQSIRDNGGGMEYPTLALVSTMPNERLLDLLIEHELGHNWYYGVLASNERDHPWMDEGMNTYYDARYMNEKYPPSGKKGFSAYNEVYLSQAAWETVASICADQPIELPSEQFTWLNYNLIPYFKTARWLESLEKELDRQRFDSLMRCYYDEWKFRHPYPEDFTSILAPALGEKADHYFGLLNSKGSLFPGTEKKKWAVSFVPRLDTNNRHRYINIGLIAGGNSYDGFMPGLSLHNYNFPLPRFQFALSGMYGLRSKEPAGIGRVTYAWYPANLLRRVELGAVAARFSYDEFKDARGERTTLQFTKLAPFLRFTLNPPSARSELQRFIQMKYYSLREDRLLFFRDPLTQEDRYRKTAKTSGISELRYVTDHSRVLYSYRWELRFESGDEFYRAQFTGNYFFNFSGKGGVNLRWFGGAFFYGGGKTSLKEFNTGRYHLNMTGPKGEEDYTYSNYFIGRSEFEAWRSQQIMIRDGGFKVRTDLLSNKVGRSDEWLLSINLTSAIPQRYDPLQVLPFKLPVKLFLDLGTYAEAWDEDATDTKFLYDFGFQFSFFKDILNIYVPLAYSKQYREYFKSTPDNDFFQRISFSIDIQQLTLKKLGLPLSY